MEEIENESAQKDELAEQVKRARADGEAAQAEALEAKALSTQAQAAAKTAVEAVALAKIELQSTRRKAMASDAKLAVIKAKALASRFGAAVLLIEGMKDAMEHLKRQEEEMESLYRQMEGASERFHTSVLDLRSANHEHEDCTDRLASAKTLLADAVGEEAKRKAAEELESAKVALEAAEKARVEAQKVNKREEAVQADIAKDQEAVCTNAKEAADEISKRIESMETMKTSAIKSALTKVKTLRRFQRQKTRQHRKMQKVQRMRKKSMSRAFTEKGAQMRLLKLQGKLNGLATQDHRVQQELESAAKSIADLEAAQKELQSKGLDEGKRGVLEEMARLRNENSSLIKRIAGIEEEIADMRGRWDQYLEVAAANWRVYIKGLRGRIEKLRTEKPDLFSGKETKAELRIKIQKEAKRLAKVQKHITTAKRNIKKVTQDTSSGGERTKMWVEREQSVWEGGASWCSCTPAIVELPSQTENCIIPVLCFAFLCRALRCLALYVLPRPFFFNL